ncbi:nitrate reductase subunit beta [Geobacter sp. SVR]|uniref:nitrate reductase subunit beta n=1 Tax=Geobacter sp. SVR TaxID=2495594 RepID=UPI00143F0189|nr:nitrate reductase subunit beta [Geobacter sp. SVR]BCS52456.1 nitrate reductase subunit beta [Geobacter sp. SVR]GCF84107.1 nitrate reductase subunit beta [Geobacter sp. SVR]
MDVRAQLVMVLNLDKCIGCHTCSLSCKNIWTDRQGAEYMWWNNLETKPGAGYPKQWEDQGKFKGGWVRENGTLKLRALGKLPTLLNIFFQPNMPRLDDYYEPFTHDYANLYRAAEDNDQPVADTISLVTGKKIDTIKGGPNWDDDLSGSSLYAAKDVNLEDRKILEEYDRLFMFYIPRLCNHCLNPACVAACPSRAIYKRGEDGVVLVDQEVCKGWRFCTSACPYKKVYYNWTSGKAEKCIFCYPRTETGQCNACAHSCTGRIRYLGVILYDAEQVEAGLNVEDRDLIAAHRSLILDPLDPRVLTSARANGIPEAWLTAAAKSPAYTLIKETGMALPLHPEFRTMPMAYYIPPLSPVLSSKTVSHELMAYEGIPSLETLRAPIGYLANLFSGGNQEVVAEVISKLIVLRKEMRRRTLGGEPDESVLGGVGLEPALVERLCRLFTNARYNERNVIPPQQREALEPERRKGGRGFGLAHTARGGL